MSAEAEPAGALVLSNRRAERLAWHHSVAFDGSTHETACGEEIDCEHVQAVERDPQATWERYVVEEDACAECEQALFGDDEEGGA